MQRLTFRYALLLGAFASLAACGGGDRARGPGVTYEAEEKERGAPNELARAYYAEKGAFFLFRSGADIPANLSWRDGSDLEAFGDPAARRGGTQFSAIESWPPTLRVVGPDANSSFRSVLLDDNSVALVMRHPNADGYYPGLAREWAVGPDNQTVYFRLDPDVRWSDGVPVNADDYMFMFFFFQSPYIQEPWYNNWYTEEYESITKFDDYTIAIKLREPKPDPVERAALRPIPEHFYAELGDDFPQRYQWRVEPTTGPYTILPSGLEEGRAITTTRVSNWWANDKKFFAHRFNPDRVLYQLVRDRDKAFEMFKLGELDMFNLLLPPKYWYDQINIPEVDRGFIHKTVFYTYEPRPPIGVWMNSAKPLLSNRDIREGIQYALNWDKVVQIVLRGDGRRLAPWADSHGDFSHPTLTSRPYDIDRALAAFARAGFTRRGSDGILTNESGARLSFTLTFGSPVFADIPPIFREDAAKAGLELQIEQLDPTAAFLKALQKNHEVYLGGWAGGAEFAPRFWEFFHGSNAGKPNTNNTTNTSVAALDRLIERYDRSTNKEEMVRLAHQMIELIHSDASYSPGFVQPFIRWGHWRWVKFPSWVNVREAQYAGQYGVHWIDEEARTETRAARRSGESFPRTETVDERWKSR